VTALRTRDTKSPFPEEPNRQIITRIAAFHLAPTNINSENLVLEGAPGEQIFVTGNTGIDMLRWASAQEVPYGIERLDALPADVPVVVVTAHRRENWGPRLAGVARAVAPLEAPAGSPVG
jgi:UDP-N-acetylglucosamine 2-epimerase (non-hydrolysing)